LFVGRRPAPGAAVGIAAPQVIPVIRTGARCCARYVVVDVLARTAYRARQRHGREGYVERNQAAARVRQANARYGRSLRQVLKEYETRRKGERQPRAGMKCRCRVSSPASAPTRGSVCTSAGSAVATAGCSTRYNGVQYGQRRTRQENGNASRARRTVALASSVQEPVA